MSSSNKENSSCISNNDENEMISSIINENDSRASPELHPFQATTAVSYIPQFVFDELKKKYDELLIENINLKKQLNLKDQFILQLQQENNKLITHDIEQLRKENQRLSNENVLLKQQVNHLESRVGELETTFRRLEQSNEELNSKITRFEQSDEELKLQALLLNDSKAYIECSNMIADAYKKFLQQFLNNNSDKVLLKNYLKKESQEVKGKTVLIYGISDEFYSKLKTEGSLIDEAYGQFDEIEQDDQLIEELYLKHQIHGCILKYVKQRGLTASQFNLIKKIVLERNENKHFKLPAIHSNIFKVKLKELLNELISKNLNQDVKQAAESFINCMIQI